MSRSRGVFTENDKSDPGKNMWVKFGGDETRSGYVQYVQGIQPNAPAVTTFIHANPVNLVFVWVPVPGIRR